MVMIGDGGDGESKGQTRFGKSMAFVQAVYWAKSFGFRRTVIFPSEALT